MARRRTPAATPQGSKRAKQIAVAVLETLSGELSTTEAADRLKISLSRYYQLEARALAGLLQAVEPRAKGPQRTPEREIDALKAEKKALEKELRRQQALLRAAHRSVGLTGSAQKRASSKGRVRARRGSRGATVLQTLRRDTDGPEEEADGTAKRDDGPGGCDRGEP